MSTSSEISEQATATKEAVEALFEELETEIDNRVAQIQRVSTSSEDTSEEAAASALTEATDYLATLGVSVA